MAPSVPKLGDLVMIGAVLICHSSFGVSESLCAAVRQVFPAATLLTADNLTDGYNLAEHECPRHILIEDQLAETHGFELMAALIKILGIRCWIVQSNDRSPIPSNDTALGSISSQACADDIFAILNAGTTKSGPPDQEHLTASQHTTYRRDSLILLGASTGGVDALVKILSVFSSQTPPALIVQHTGGKFTNSLIRLLDSVTKARVRSAIENEKPVPGHVYLAAGDEMHLCLSGKTTPRISLRREGLVSGHRPSVDALFRSARPFAPRIAAALLTGMGQDGARGLLALREAGAQTFGQDRASSVVYGMPRVAMEIGAVGKQLPIGAIGPALLSACAAKVRA